MSGVSTEIKALQRAIKLAGGQPELARRIVKAGKSIAQQTISYWIERGAISPGWAIWIARAVDFDVTPHDLDRANYPNPWDGLPIDRAKPLVLELAA